MPCLACAWDRILLGGEVSAFVEKDSLIGSNQKLDDELLGRLNNYVQGDEVDCLGQQGRVPYNHIRHTRISV